MSASTTTMTVRVSSDVKDRLDELAQSTSRSRSWLAADAISEYLRIHEWQVAEIQQGVSEADEGKFASDADVAAVIAKWSDED